MAVFLSPVGGVAAQFFTNTGAVLTGGKLYTYASGTTTPVATYTTGAGAVAWTNPIVLDAAGRVPNGGEIWLTDGVQYKFVLKDSTDVLIATYDNITGINSNFINFLAEQEIQTATAGQTVFTLTTTEYQPGTNTLSVFVDGVNQYGPGAQYAYTETSSTVVTFNSGLHVGAEVKFTTTQTLSGGAVDASQVVYDPPFASAVATNVEAKLAQTVSVLDYGADPTGVSDSTTAIQNAITANKYVVIPYGVYRCDGIITIQSTYSSQKHVQMQGAQLIRQSANSAATGAVIQLLGSYGSFDGGNGLITTQNNSPQGVVTLGHADNTTSNYTAVHWSFKNVTIETKVFGSSPTIYQAIGVYVPSSQPYLGSGATNYFGTVENVNVQNASIAFWLTDLVNGCTFTNCTVNGFWFTAFTLQGAYGNTFYGGFLEYCYQNSKVAIQLLTKLYPTAPYASTLESMWNNFYGSTMELYATSMIGLQIDAGCQGNFVQFNWNSVGEAIVDSDGFNTILESRVNQFTKVASNTLTGVGSAAQEIGILPTGASYVAAYGVYVESSGNFYPNVDNTMNLGKAAKRWKEVFAANGTINTSDARLKEQDRLLSDAEQAVAVKVKGLLKAFKFKDAVQAKGNKARIHFGVYAQEVVEAFASEGLDANNYSMLCFDKWDAQEAVVDRDGNITKPAQEAGESYGIRYEELLAFIIAAI